MAPTASAPVKATRKRAPNPFVKVEEVHLSTTGILPALPNLSAAVTAWAESHGLQVRVLSSTASRKSGVFTITNVKVAPAEFSFSRTRQTGPTAEQEAAELAESTGVPVPIALKLVNAQRAAHAARLEAARAARKAATK